MTEFQNAQAIEQLNTNDHAPALESRADAGAKPIQNTLGSPPPSGGDAGPSAAVMPKPKRKPRSATIGGNAGREAMRDTPTISRPPLAIPSAQAEPSAKILPQPTVGTRSATISPAIHEPGTTLPAQAKTRATVEPTPLISAAPASTLPAKAGQAAIADAHTDRMPQPATTPARKPRAVSGHVASEPQRARAADSNPPASDGGDGGPRPHENQRTNAAVNLPSGDGGASGHSLHEIPGRRAARKTKRRQASGVTHVPTAAPGGDEDATLGSKTMAQAHPVTALLIPMVRRHSQWHQAWMRLVLQGRAIGRGAAGGDKKAGSKLYDDAVAGKFAPENTDLAVTLTPLIIATERLAIEIVPIDKAIEKIAKMHPLWPWAKEVYGIGPGSLGKIIAAAHSPALEDRDGNPRTPAFEISDYRSVAGLWKRFGLAVINGERQRMKSGIEGIEHAYAPRRRALMWNVGGGLIGCMKKGPRPLVGEDVDARDDLSPYQKLFVARLRYEAERDPAMRLPDAVKDGIAKESYKTHASNRARRYVEKRFLRNLYAAAQAVAGRGLEPVETHGHGVAPQSNSAGQPVDGRGQGVFEHHDYAAAPSLPTEFLIRRHRPYLVGDRGPEVFVPESSKSRTEKQI